MRRHTFALLGLSTLSVACSGLSQPAVDGARDARRDQPSDAPGTPVADGLLLVDQRSEQSFWRDGSGACGGLNEACCAGTLKCTASGTACGSAGRCIACGAPSQICCAASSCKDSKTSCSSGTCVTCGGLGQPCCPGQICNFSTATCYGGTCVACGNSTAPCCLGNGCASGGCCVNQLCVASGGSCATGGTCGNGSCGACLASGKTCTWNAATCSNGSCGGCGAEGQPCCPPVNGCTAPGVGCSLSGTAPVCVKCGAVGGPCCYEGCTNGCCWGQTCVAVGASIPSQGSFCAAANSIVKCGLTGQPPCPGPTCGSGGCVDPSWRDCVPNGAAGSVAGKICANGTFVACGAVGQPCCEEHGCGGDACCAGGVCIGQGQSCGGGLSGTCSDTALGGCGACGGEGQACCGHAIQFCTASNLTCDSGSTWTCKGCGAPGKPCCEGNVCLGKGCCVDGNTCVAPGSSCNYAHGNCVAGYCEDSGGSCGGIGMDDCGASTPCSAPYATYDAGKCAPCGSQGQACCQSSDVAFSTCSPGLACDGSKCEPCGLSHQPCCDGMFCLTGACTFNGVCP